MRAARGGDDPNRPGHRRGDAGSGTVLAVGLTCSVLLLLTLMLGLGGAMVASHRARSAADLAALAAAGVVPNRPGSGNPCLAAGSIARANGARLERCQVTPSGVVEVSVRTPGPPWVPLPAVAVARAGPATEPAYSSEVAP